MVECSLLELGDRVRFPVGSYQRLVRMVPTAAQLSIQHYWVRVGVCPDQDLKYWRSTVAVTPRTSKIHLCLFRKEQPTSGGTSDTKPDLKNTKLTLSPAHLLHKGGLAGVIIQIQIPLWSKQLFSKIETRMRHSALKKK